MAVTEFPKIIHALTHLRVPAILTTIISFLYRYLFVLTDEVMRMLAGAAGPLGSRSRRPVRWKRCYGGRRSPGNMAGQFFLRSYERSDRIYNAMLSRGYKGQLMTIHPHQFQRSDLLVGVFSILCSCLHSNCGTAVMTDIQI